MKEIELFHTQSGLTLYCVVMKKGQAWNNDNGVLALEAFDPLNWAQYAMAMTESADLPGWYYLDAPAGLPEGSYAALVFNQAGGSAAIPPTDTLLAQAELAWNGTGEVTVDSLLSENVDSTATETISVRKALEAMLAVLAGKADFDASGGVERFKGRDGATAIVTSTILGNGHRTESVIS